MTRKTPKKAVLKQPTNSDIMRVLVGVEGKVSGLQKDVSGLKHDVSGLKHDVSGLKHDVSGLKQNVAYLPEMKKDIAGLKNDVSGLKQDHELMLKSINEFSQYVENRFDHVDDNIEILQTSQEELKLRQDNVAYRFELVDLERRVKRLEHIKR